jgi:hypothetical protein
MIAITRPDRQKENSHGDAARWLDFQKSIIALINEDGGKMKRDIVVIGNLIA